ncbi:MAG: hypothetical protein ACJ74Q_21465 [Pyrinomonadaceae bacterium]
MTTDIVVGRARGRGRGVVLLRPSTPAAPPESSVLVSGAGNADADGTYTPRGTLNGRTYYNLEGEPDDSEVSAILWNGLQWLITLNDGSVGYSNDGDVPNPWDAVAWNAIDGHEPVPTVTEA